MFQIWIAKKFSPTSQFCGQCGKPFVNMTDCTCPSCKSVYIVGQNFCKNCGIKLPVSLLTPITVQEEDKSKKIKNWN